MTCESTRNTSQNGENTLLGIIVLIVMPQYQHLSVFNILLWLLIPLPLGPELTIKKNEIKFSFG